MTEQRAQPNPRSSAFSAFRAWVERLEADSLPLTLLRPREFTEDHAFTGDFDFIADPSAFPAIVEAALRSSIYHEVSVEIDQRAMYKRVLSFLATSPCEDRIKVELWPHAELWLSDRRPGMISWKSIEPLLFENDQALNSALGLIYITHLYYKRKRLDSSEVEHRLDLVNDSVVASGDTYTQSIIDDIRSSGNLAAANRRAIQQLERLGLQADRLPGISWRRALRLSRRFVRRAIPTSEVIPVLGPDGSGKTSVIDAILRRAQDSGRDIAFLSFKRVFRDALIMRLANQWRKWRGLRSPTKSLARNLFEERHPHLVLITALSRWPLVVSKLSITGSRNGLASPVSLADRYFWDYLIRPRDPRYKATPVSGLRVYKRLIPKQDRMVVLACKPSILRDRKGELSDNAVTSIYRFYSEQIAEARAGRILLVPTTGPLEASIGEVERFLGLVSRD